VRDGWESSDGLFRSAVWIKYGSNWQMKLNNREVKDGSDEALTGEPEQIRAYRDTWELGIHFVFKLSEGQVACCEGFADGERELLCAD